MSPTRRLRVPAFLAVFCALALIAAQVSGPWSAASPRAAAMTVQQVDGGPGFYGGFSSPLPSSSSYFPLGVWFESVVDQSDVTLDKAAGLNLYVVLTADSDLTLVHSNGMAALLQGD